MTAIPVSGSAVINQPRLPNPRTQIEALEARVAKLERMLLADVERRLSALEDAVF